MQQQCIKKKLLISFLAPKLRFKGKTRLYNKKKVLVVRRRDRTNTRVPEYTSTV